MDVTFTEFIGATPAIGEDCQIPGSIAASSLQVKHFYDTECVTSDNKAKLNDELVKLSSEMYTKNLVALAHKCAFDIYSSLALLRSDSSLLYERIRNEAELRLLWGIP